MVKLALCSLTFQNAVYFILCKQYRYSWKKTWMLITLILAHCTITVDTNTKGLTVFPKLTPLMKLHAALHATPDLRAPREK